MKSVLKKSLALLLALTALVTVLSACTVEKAYPGAPEGMRPLTEGHDGIILYVPINWNVDVTAVIPTAYLTATDRAMITFITLEKSEWQSEAGDKTVTQYWAESKTKISALPEFKMTVPEGAQEGADHFATATFAGNTEVQYYRYRYSFKPVSASQPYLYEQTYFVNPKTGAMHVITYSAIQEYFSTHEAVLADVYFNLKFTDTPVPFEEEIIPPAFTPNVKGTPEGYSALTNDSIDYTLFVPSDWKPLSNTGITAASAPSDPEVTVSVTAFNVKTSINTAADADLAYDEYFAALEKSISDSFGVISFTEPSEKFTKTDIKVDIDSEYNTVSARIYTYKVDFNGKSYVYRQYLSIYRGYFYQITFCCEESKYPAYVSTFDSIATSFRFKY